MPVKPRSLIKGKSPISHQSSASDANFLHDSEANDGGGKLETRLLGGLNAVLAALKNRAKSCRSVMIAEGRHANPALNEIYALIRANNIPLKNAPRSAFDRLYSGRHQGVLAYFDPLEYADEDFLLNLPAKDNMLLLALDQLEDPANLGALMRSAYIFGAEGIIAPRQRMVALSAAAFNAAAGAAEKVPLIRVTNLCRTLKSLKEQGFWIVGAEQNSSENLFDFEFPTKTVLVLGSEGKGISPIIIKTCDFLVTVPQSVPEAPSLNVGAAGAILMCEFFRQKS